MDRSWRLVLPVVLAALPLVSCDVPTGLPRWDTRWLLPLESGRIGVGSLLPKGVRVASDGSGFDLDLPPETLTRTLRQMCGTPCDAAAGLTVPKPAFGTTFGTELELPADLVSAQLATGQLRVQLSHNLGFDPLRPSATARGYIVLRATSGGRVVAQDSIAGQTVALPPNTPLVRQLAMSPGAITSPISVSVTIFSPAGDPVRVDPNQQITLVFTPQQVRVSQAQVRVASHTITGGTVQLDLQDLDDAVIEQVREGTLRVAVTNPFPVSGTLNVTISWPGGAITRPVQLQPGSQEFRIALSRAEIGAMLASGSVTIGFTGTVTAASGTVTVTPTQELLLEPRLELVIGSGGDS